ncbi:MAG: cox cluster protein [Haloferacaceae archaeon]
MSENAGVSDQYSRASPWPLFVALGLAVGELGILFNLFPVAVGGLLLLCGSVAGMGTESGYASTPWRALVVCGVVVLVLGGLLLYADGQAGPEIARLAERGYAMLTAAGIMLLGGIVGEVLERREQSPV